jgi:hypothetical protein
MKQKYILANYDKLINEIKYHRNTTDAEIISFLKKAAKESFYLHQIHFIKQKGIINYSFQKKVHNLHPLAVPLNGPNENTDSDLDKMIPLILKKLNIREELADYYWFSENNKRSLIIQEPCRIEDLPFEERFFLYCFQIVKNENLKILLNHKESVFCISSKVKMEHYIHRKQNAMEILSYGLIKDINPIVSKDIYNLTSDYSIADCLKITYIYLEKLQIFIEKESRNYVDVNKQVPYKTLLVKEFQIIDKLNWVQSQLLEMNMSDDLRKMAFIPLLKMATTNIQDKISYCEFNYCTEYIEELSRKFEHNKEVEEANLEEWLLDLNYNSLDFFDFVTDRIISSMENQESDIEKIGILYHLLKSYNQRPARRLAKLNQNLPCIKDQIINWIDEEIEYLTRKKKLEANKNVEPTIKIKTSFSVKQLCYFFYLLVQCGILLPKNHTDIFRFISNNFKTDKIDKIAYQSAKNNFYAAESAVVAFVRSKIFGLWNFTKT